MFKTWQRVCVALVVIVFYCDSYDCLEVKLKYTVINDEENVGDNPEETHFEEIIKDSVEIVPSDAVKFIYDNDKRNKEEDLRAKVSDRLKKNRIIRQTGPVNGYTPLYPQVPSAPPYGYPSASQQSQWNGNSYNNSYPGYQGYKPTNYSSPYNSNQGSYNPSQRPYNQGTYNSSNVSNYPHQGSYNPNQGTYNPNHGPYNTSPGIFNSSQGYYNQNNKPYTPSQGIIYPNQGQYNHTQGPNQPIQNNLGLTPRPYNQGPYNPNQGPYNPSAGLTPYGGYPTQRSNTTNPYQNPTPYPPHSNTYRPQNSSQYPGFGQANNSYPGQSFNNNYPGYNPSGNQHQSINPYASTTPYNYNMGQQNFNNNPYPQQYPNGSGLNPSQYPQNSNPYGQNINSYSQYPNSNPQYPNSYNQNSYSHNTNLSYPQYQPHS